MTGDARALTGLLYASLCLSIRAFDCHRYENDPSGLYLAVRPLTSVDLLPPTYRAANIDLTYYRRLALAQPAALADSQLQIPILGAWNADDRSVASASFILSSLNVRPEVLKAAIDAGAYVAVIGEGGSPCDAPELINRFCHVSWGGVNVQLPGQLAVVVRSESVRCLWLNGYRQHGGTLVHEFVHALEFANRLQARSQIAYRSAVQQGLWRDTYIDKGPVEYLPVGAEVYLNLPLNVAYEWPVRNRDQLRTYDPQMYSILEQLFDVDRLIDGENICLYTCD